MMDLDRSLLSSLSFQARKQPSPGNPSPPVMIIIRHHEKKLVLVVGVVVVGGMVVVVLIVIEIVMMSCSMLFPPCFPPLYGIMFRSSDGGFHDSGSSN